ncbi:hypothetical protein [Microbacterium sp. Root61]|uniref:hypothetical protein n=1 Tax=Microbacterium sp. Root61 TaxID=1736570 RepID=UPI0012E3BFFE|nr:hypothetical protein [Microbacterium sp. Root61]
MEGMTVVFDGMVWSSYAQMQLTTGETSVSDPREAFVGQTNGLCGAARDGALFLITGLHTGQVRVQVVLADVAPELGDWEEVVEVDFYPNGLFASLSGWASDPSITFPLASVNYRARWCATAMDAGRAQDTADETNPAPDRYALYLWPAQPTHDTILRRTSEIATYWHDDGFSRV